ncbi:hypothetical protein CH364_09810 [Leptospira harrisiae]|uniref:site-specific DNA-methyltransferase (adenine-specific) n=1 Tax=Leptospira harrisiae TaxID=2023189 RepID=A0A2N0AQ42_9LEPT|nr:Eco57I restriction-modification methylase domain-containing protein [Leptospira harrisiae]PJZ86434.1 hypothetical protein CH364_09810 [Leptospira harrisiae]
MKNKGLEIIEKKVEDFGKNENLYLSKTFQETEARNRFIDPFFQSLGWEFDQTNIPRNLWDVHREYSQKDNSSTKKPDYAFRLNSKLMFFVEAKAPWVPLTDKDPVFQAKRYAYSTRGKAPIVIITDFQEFRVFNALEKPIYENPTQGLIKEFDLKYTDYIEKWDFIYDNFSKEAVLNGSLDTLRGKISKSTKTLDDEFLTQLSNWRETLALNIARKNLTLSVDELNEAVQRILDRLVFIRQLEDRNIIEENTLRNLIQKNTETYSNLLPFFGELNAKYNGLLFKPHLSEKLLVDDKVIKEIALKLCYPKSPFQFDIIEPEILGRIYEKFLGSKIRLTEKHLAKVEEKPEVIHAKGVYYTPEFIVEEIVKETVGKKIQKMTPDTITKIKILDPACGSGSFLLGAYQYIMNYHIDFYKKDKSKKYKDDFFIDANGELKLSAKKKGEILLNNIYGVDLDREATEVAILSLYLKLLEEGLEDDSYLFLKGKILPDMTKNIKCGNSLISREDLFANDMFKMTENDSNKMTHSMTTEIKTFDWNTEFPFGGFDCIIGNPPYIRIQELQKWAKEEVELYKKIFKSGSKGNFDIYILFIEQTLHLLNENGISGMILPHKFLNAAYGDHIRDLIKKGNHLSKIVHFGDIQIFNQATTYTCLLFLTKFSNTDISVSKVENLENWIKNGESVSGKVASNSLSNHWNFSIGEDIQKIEKISHITTTLEDVTERIFQGLKTSADKIYILELKEETKQFYKVYSRHLEKDLKLEKEILHPLMKGGDSKRYALNRNTGLLILFPYDKQNDEKVSLIPEKEIKEKYPEIYNYLKECKSYLENRENGKMKGSNWYAFGRTQALEVISRPKIFTPDIAPIASYTFDDSGEMFFTGGAAGGYGILPKENINPYYLLGLLNSKLLDEFNKRIATKMRGGWYSFESRFIKSLPIYVPDSNDTVKFAITKKIEEFSKNIIEFKKNQKLKDAEFLEGKIDTLVEELYTI